MDGIPIAQDVRGFGLKELEESAASPYDGRAMDNALLDRKTASRKSGTLSLFHASENAAVTPDPYGRFRVCRGFIDDLNRVLPIRLRIQLEGDISKGALTGGFQAGTVRYRWEFQVQ